MPSRGEGRDVLPVLVAEVAQAHRAEELAVGAEGEERGLPAAVIVHPEEIGAAPGKRHAAGLMPGRCLHRTHRRRPCVGGRRGESDGAEREGNEGGEET